MRIRRSLLTCPCVLLLSAATMAQSSGDGGFVWTGAQSLNWAETENWLFNGEEASTIPGCGDELNLDISIPDVAGPIMMRCPANAEIVLNEFHAAVDTNIARRLILNGDSTLKNPVSIETFALEVNASLLIEGTGGIWDRGTWDGGGAISICDGLSIRGVGSRGLNTWINNDGTVNMDAGLELSNWEGIDAKIESSGTWQGQGGISRTNAPTATFEASAGTIRGMALPDGTATGPLRFSLPFDTSGSVTLHAQTEDIRISFGGSHQASGALQVSNDRSILIDSQPGALPMQFVGAHEGTGVGQLHINRDVDLLGQLMTNYSDQSSLGLYLDNNATLNITGIGSLTNRGKMTWKGGTINSINDVLNENGGTIHVVPGGTTIPTIGMNTTLSQRATMRQLSKIRVDEGAQLKITGGTYEIHADRIEGLGVLSFDQSGLLLHPIDAPPGFVEVRTTLNLEDAQIINELGDMRLISSGAWCPAPQILVHAEC